MNLTVNGEVRHLTARDISELVTALGLEPAVTLVEHNGTALRREEWHTELADGDRLEIIRVVAGG